MYKGVINKSRSLDFQAIILAIGVLELNLPMVREQLGDQYGWIFIGISIIGTVLRYLTTGPVGQK